MGKNFITAADARILNTTTDKLISQAFKCIKNEAENGFSEFDFDTYRVSVVAFTNLNNELIKAGFKLSYYYPEYLEDGTKDEEQFRESLIENKVPAIIKITW